MSPAPVARADALRAEIRGHKAEIRRRRGALARTKYELVALEAECAARGIKLVISGEGEDPWPTKNRSSTSTP